MHRHVLLPSGHNSELLEVGVNVRLILFLLSWGAGEHKHCGFTFINFHLVIEGQAALTFIRKRSRNPLKKWLRWLFFQTAHLVQSKPLLVSKIYKKDLSGNFFSRIGTPEMLLTFSWCPSCWVLRIKWKMASFSDQIRVEKKFHLYVLFYHHLAPVFL